MKHLEPDELRHWVKERLAPLQPAAGEEPDVRRGRARLAALAFEPRRRWRPDWRWAAATAAIVVAVTLTSPGARAGARLWQWLTVARIDVADGMRALAVRDVQEATARLGYVPRLPSGAGLTGEPRLSVLEPTAVTTFVLQPSSSPAESGSREWDPLALTLEMGPRLSAEWPEATLMQGPPPIISLTTETANRAAAEAVLQGPQGAFYAAAPLTLRSTSSSSGDRGGPHRVERVLSAPELFHGRHQNEVSVRSVTLDTGPATLVRHVGKGGEVTRVALLWRTPDRVYALSGSLTPENAVALANTIR